jgi:hypothetical protein
MNKGVVACLITAFASTSACADEFYGGFGVLSGAHAGFSHSMSESFGMRAEAHSFSYSRSVSVSGSKYAAQADFSGATFYLDWMPLTPITSDFRITAGLGLGKNELRAGKSSGTSVTLGDNTYSLNPDDTFGLNLRYPSTMPYLGIGTGHHRAQKGFNFYADAGVFFGKPELTFDYSNSFLSRIQTPLNPGGDIGVDQLMKEEAKVRAEADKIKFMPTVKLGVTYRFD